MSPEDLLVQRSRTAAGALALALGAALVPSTTASAAVDPGVTACPADVTSDVGFSDVGSGTAFQRSIYCVADLGIASGTGGGAYSPDSTLTRRQMATFYYRLACSLQFAPENAADTGPTPEDCKNILPTAAANFGDLEGAVSGEQLDAINFLANVGVVQGTSVGTFSPNAQLTRLQMAAFIDRFQAYAGHKKGVDGQDVSTAASAGATDTGYADAGRANPFLDIGDGGIGEHVKDIVAAQITNGVTPKEYRPGDPLTRKQMAEFLARQMESNSVNGYGNWVFEAVSG